MLKETEANPFEGEDEEEETPAPATHSRQASSGQSSKTLSSFNPLPLMSSLAEDKKSKKEKDKKKKKAKSFNLESEKGKIKETIADSSLAATNLMNAMRMVNREQQQVSENQNVQSEFDMCKKLRRQILRYVSASNSVK